jgi:hypothetical protein
MVKAEGKDRSGSPVGGMSLPGWALLVASLMILGASALFTLYHYILFTDQVARIVMF